MKDRIKLFYFLFGCKRNDHTKIGTCIKDFLKLYIETIKFVQDAEPETYKISQGIVFSVIFSFGDCFYFGKS